jgi:hypothetical protein
MPVNTRRVTGRRPLHFESFDELLADADRLAAADVDLLGNWSLGQVFRHLAIATNGSIDGFAFRLPRVSTWVVRLGLKSRYLARGIRPGHGTSRRWDSVKPGPTTVADGLAELHAAVARFKREPGTRPHPAFGRMTDDEWHSFHLRHAELHLSFAVPRA